MIKRILALLVCTVLMLIALTGCQNDSGTAQATASGGTTLMGQVTAIDGDNITLALGEQNNDIVQPEGTSSGNFVKPDGTPSGDFTSGKPDAPQGNAPSGTSAPRGSMAPRTTGEQPSGNFQGGDGKNMPGGMGGLTLTGEEQTITVADSTVITVFGVGDNTKGSVSDIAVGDILMVTLSGNSVTAITVMQGGFGGMMNGGEMPTSSPQS